MSQKIDEMKSQQEIMMDEIIQLKEAVKLLEAELSRVKKGNIFNGKDDYDHNKDEKEKYKVNHFSFDDKSDPRGFISNIGNSMITIAGGNSNPENPLQNIKIYDDSFFYYFDGKYKPCSEKDS